MNCQVRVAYAPNQYDTAELLSKMIGAKTVQKATFNFSGSRFAPIANHMSATVDQVERPLVTPDEVMRLKPPKKAGHGAGECIVAPGDMLIFVSGHYPIYGTQILYFTDSVLAKRAEIPPPTSYAAIEEAPPATCMEEAFRAEMVQPRRDGFIEQLDLDYHDAETTDTTSERRS